MDDRRRHWEQIYTGKSPEAVSWYQSRPERSLALARAAGISLDSPVLDVGGGASTLVDCLLTERYARVAVLDISARPGAGSYSHRPECKKVEWFEVDVTAFRPPHRFGLWHDRAVFHFSLTPPTAPVISRPCSVPSIPRPHHYAAFAVGGPTRCSGLDIMRYDSAKLVNVLGNRFSLLEERSETHRTPAEKEQPFSYFSFRRNTFS